MVSVGILTAFLAGFGLAWLCFVWAMVVMRRTGSAQPDPEPKEGSE